MSFLNQEWHCQHLVRIKTAADVLQLYLLLQVISVGQTVASHLLWRFLSLCKDAQQHVLTFGCGLPVWAYAHILLQLYQTHTLRERECDWATDMQRKLQMLCGRQTTMEKLHSSLEAGQVKLFFTSNMQYTDLHQCKETNKQLNFEETKPQFQRTHIHVCSWTPNSSMQPLE